MRWFMRTFLVFVCALLVSGPFVAADDTQERIDTLVEQLGAADFAMREVAQESLIDIGEPALPALRQAATSNDFEVELRARTALRVIDLRQKDPGLTRQLTTEELGEPESPFWPLFQKEILDGPDARSIYGELLDAEPELFAMAYEAVDPALAAEERETKTRAFLDELARVWTVAADRYNEQTQKRIKKRDFPYLRPANRGDRVSVAALYFLRGTARAAGPSKLANVPYRFQYGFNPFKNAGGGKKRNLAWQRCVAFGLQTARTDIELRRGMKLATLYREWDTARVLARRAAAFDDITHDTHFLAAHTLIARGRGEQDQLAAFRLLFVTSAETPASWSGKTIPERRYLEIREIALQALMKMNGIDPGKRDGFVKITPTCPVARKVEMFYVKDARRWPTIIEQWGRRLGVNEPVGTALP